jgi:hypothetical protein
MDDKQLQQSVIDELEFRTECRCGSYRGYGE